MTDQKGQIQEEQKTEGEKAEEAKPTKEPAEEKPQETKVEKPKVEKKPAASGKFKDLIEQIEKLSVSELADLVKALEERFGVSAAMPMAAGAVAAGGSAGEEQEEAKSSYTVHLTSSGDQKIAVIKAVRVIRPDLGLKEAKDLVDGAPKDVKADVPKAEAEEAKKKLEAAGGKVELK